MGDDPRAQLHRQRGVPVLALSGDLDLYSARQLRQIASDLVDQALAAASEPVPATTKDPGSGHRPDEHPNPADGPVANQAAETEAPHELRHQVIHHVSPQVRHDVLVLDLAAVPFTDSAGLGTLVALMQRARSHRAGLAIAGANPALDQTLRLMGLTKVIALFTTAEAAVDAATATRAAHQPAPTPLGTVTSTPDLNATTASANQGPQLVPSHLQQVTSKPPHPRLE